MMSQSSKTLIGCLMVMFSPLLLAEVSSAEYSPLGKRDPFQVPRPIVRDVATYETDLFRYPVEQFQLKAILKSRNKSQILVEDPKGKNYVLEEGAVLGRGKATISRILDKEVILTEKGINYLGAQELSEKVLSLVSEESREP